MTNFGKSFDSLKKAEKYKKECEEWEMSRNGGRKTHLYELLVYDN